jgi:ribosome modulation factor
MEDRPVQGAANGVFSYGEISCPYDILKKFAGFHARWLKGWSRRAQDSLSVQDKNASI